MGGNPISGSDPTGEFAPAIAACIANPPICAALIAATSAAIAHGASGAWGAIVAPGNNSKSDDSESTATPHCPPANLCGPDTREQAMIKAYVFAGIPLDGGECTPIPFSDYNNKGRNYALLRGMQVNCMGYRACVYPHLCKSLIFMSVGF